MVKLGLAGPDSQRHDPTHVFGLIGVVVCGQAAHDV